MLAEVRIRPDIKHKIRWLWSNTRVKRQETLTTVLDVFFLFYDDHALFLIKGQITACFWPTLPYAKDAAKPLLMTIICKLQKSAIILSSTNYV